MKKKIAVVMALILLCGGVFAACGKEEKTNPNSEEITTESESMIPVLVSETQYVYATNPDGSYETVIATDAEGNTKTYLKGVKPAATDNAAGNDGSGAGAAEESSLFEVQNSPVVSSFIDILNSGAFEMNGYITADGEKMPLTFCCFEQNVRMGTEVEGIALDFAMIDGTAYLLSDAAKSYIELTDTIKRSLGFDEDLLSFDGFGSISNDDTVHTEATYNGKAVDCYTATSAEGEIKFYVDGDALVKIEMYTPDGVCNTMIETTEVRGGLTAADLQIPSDYTKTSYTAFIADVMGL